MATPKINLKAPAPTQQIINVTPALAKQWLELNFNNRKLKSNKISQYARDMREENWRYTGEAIKFNKLGHLVDGQNRLHAIIDAEVTLPMLVVTGLKEDAQEVMDSGASRGASDALDFRGYNRPQELGAMARVHYVWQVQQAFTTCMNSPAATSWPSTAEVIRHVEDNPELPKLTTRARAVVRQLRLPVGSVGATYYEFRQIDEEEAEQFIDNILDFELAGKGDPIATLIKRCQEMALRREIVRPATGIFMMVKTWNAVRSGEAMQKFQFGSQPRGWALIPDPK